MTRFTQESLIETVTHLMSTPENRKRVYLMLAHRYPMGTKFEYFPVDKATPKTLWTYKSGRGKLRKINVAYLCPIVIGVITEHEHRDLKNMAEPMTSLWYFNNRHLVGPNA